MKFLMLIVLFVSTTSAFASEMVIAELGKPVRESFDSFEGTFETLPPGFAVSKDGSNCLTAADGGDFKPPHSGGTAEGACRPWDLGDGDRALGYQPTSSEFTPGFFMLTVSNVTGEAAGMLEVTYEVVCLNNEDRSCSLDLEWSRDGIVFTRIPAVTYASPTREDNPAEWVVSRRTVALRLRDPIRTGRCFLLRWYGDDNGGSGSRDEYGINNVSVTLRSRRGTVIVVR